MHTEDGWLYHIAEQSRWAAATGDNYTPADYAREGFIHLSQGHQVAATAERYYAGRTDLALLRIDPQALDSEVVAENLVGGTELFPHLYGPLPMVAVVAVGRFGWTTDGQAVVDFRFGPPCVR